MASLDEIKEEVIKVLKQIYDPEIPVNIYDLGLIYGVEVDERRDVKIKMTLTTSACPLMGILVYRVEEMIKQNVPGIRKVDVELVWDPPWTPERISPRGRELLRKFLGYDLVERWRNAQELGQR
ncbi:MAG TPA: DUF59 domain-containing protein [Nitrososphaeria archaeon]|nr:DUF59 domain-containing protein [Nitrososphaeria archaeon]